MTASDRVLDRLQPFAIEGVELSVASHSRAVGVTVGGQLDLLRSELADCLSPLGFRPAWSESLPAKGSGLCRVDIDGDEVVAVTLYGWTDRPLADDTVAVGSRCFATNRRATAYYYDVRWRPAASVVDLVDGLAQHAGFDPAARAGVVEIGTALVAMAHVHFVSIASEESTARVRVFVAEPPRNVLNSVIAHRASRRATLLLGRTNGPAGYLQRWMRADGEIGWRVYARAFPCVALLRMVTKVMDATRSVED